MTDQIKKFLLEDKTVRVSAVEMSSVWHEAIERHHFPPAVQQLLGELMCAAPLLASSLKFEGSLLLQLQGNGPIRLIVVECRADMSMRATVRLGDTSLNGQQGLRELINPDGEGRFSVILMPPSHARHLHPYQGIVPLDSDSVAIAIEQYMQQSEQLATKLWLAVSDEKIAGLMLQRMPATGGQATSDEHSAASSWEHAQALCATITAEEQIAVSTQEMLSRLFWQNPVFGLESKDILWHCGCTRERVANMLRSLGKADVDSIHESEGKVEITCEFCGEKYLFNQKDTDLLFSDPQAGSDSASSLH